MVSDIAEKSVLGAIRILSPSVTILFITNAPPFVVVVVVVLVATMH